MPDARRIALFAAGLVAGCGGGSTTDSGTPALGSLTISAPANTVVVSGVLQLTASGRTASGALASLAGTQWSTSDSAVATVSGNGTVLGVAAGLAVITVRSGGLSATREVSVVPAGAAVTVAFGADVSTALRARVSALASITGGASASAGADIPAPQDAATLVFGASAAGEPLLVGTRGSGNSVVLSVQGTAITLVGLALIPLGLGMPLPSTIENQVKAAPSFAALVATLGSSGEAGISYASSTTIADLVNQVATSVGAALAGAAGDGLGPARIAFPSFRTTVEDGPATSYLVTNNVFMPFAASVTWLSGPGSPAVIAADIPIAARDNILPGSPVAIPGIDGVARVTLGQNQLSRQVRAQTAVLAFADLVLSALGLAVKGDPVSVAVTQVLTEVFSPGFVVEVASSQSPSAAFQLIAGKLVGIGADQFGTLLVNALKRQGVNNVLLASAGVVAKNLIFIVKLPFFVNSTLTNAGIAIDWAQYGDGSEFIQVCQAAGTFEPCIASIAVVPAAGTIESGKSLGLNATTYDGVGAVTTVPAVQWSVTSGPGSLSSPTGRETTLTATSGAPQGAVILVTASSQGKLATATFNVSAPTPPPQFGDIGGIISSAQRGPLAGVSVQTSTRSAFTSAGGAYLLVGVLADTATVTLSQLPPGCIPPPARFVTVPANATLSLNFSIACTVVDTAGVRSFNRAAAP